MKNIEELQSQILHVSGKIEELRILEESLKKSLQEALGDSTVKEYTGKYVSEKSWDGVRYYHVKKVKCITTLDNSKSSVVLHTDQVIKVMPGYSSIEISGGEEDICRAIIPINVEVISKETYLGIREKVLSKL